MLKVAAVFLLCAYSLDSADAGEPFTKTTSFLCRIKCPETWFHNYDTWMTYVDCQADCKIVAQPWLSWLVKKVDCDMRKCKAVEFQPREQIAGVIIIAIVIILFVVCVVIGVCCCLISRCKALVNSPRQ